jgi:hypothetical protein
MHSRYSKLFYAAAQPQVHKRSKLALVQKLGQISTRGHRTVAAKRASGCGRSASSSQPCFALCASLSQQHGRWRFSLSCKHPPPAWTVTDADTSPGPRACAALLAVVRWLKASLDVGVHNSLLLFVKPCTFQNGKAVLNQSLLQEHRQPRHNSRCHSSQTQPGMPRGIGVHATRGGNSTGINICTRDRWMSRTS